MEDNDVGSTEYWRDLKQARQEKRAGSYQPNKVMAQLTADGVNRLGDTIAELRMEVARLREDAKRLDFLDRNHCMKMGWYVGAGLAG